MRHGALILGYSHSAIVQAVQEQVAKGVHYGENHKLEVEWAEPIKSMMPMAERVEFCSCGQEANLMAIGLGRTLLAGGKVFRFEGNLQGWADELVRESSAGVVAANIILPRFNSEVQ